MNDLRDRQVKGFSVNASFQSVDGVQRSTHRRYRNPIILASSFSCRIVARYCPADGLLHDEISVLVAAAPRKILAISTNNFTRRFYAVRAALSLVASAQTDRQNRLLDFYL